MSSVSEAALALGVGDQSGRQGLEGDEAVETGVAGPVDDAHAALTQTGLDPVVLERRSDHARAI